MQRYEYKLIDCKGSSVVLGDLLKGLGDEGWELVSFQDLPTSHTRLVLKRPKEGDKFMAGL